MDLIATGWRPNWGGFTPGYVVIIPEDYGLYGSMIDVNRTPTYEPTENDVQYNVHNPQWNNLSPIVWQEYVLHHDEISALAQAGQIQVPSMLPAVYSPPGTASVKGP